MYLINSTIFVEDGDGQTVGEVQCTPPHVTNPVILLLSDYVHGEPILGSVWCTRPCK